MFRIQHIFLYKIYILLYDSFKHTTIKVIKNFIYYVDVTLITFIVKLGCKPFVIKLIITLAFFFFLESTFFFFKSYHFLANCSIKAFIFI